MPRPCVAFILATAPPKLTKPVPFVELDAPLFGLRGDVPERMSVLPCFELDVEVVVFFLAAPLEEDPTADWPGIDVLEG